MFIATLTSAILGGLTSAGLVSVLSRGPQLQLQKELRSTARALTSRLDELDSVPQVLVEKRIVPLEDAVNKLVERLELYPKREEVAEAFKRAAELDMARRAQERQEREQLVQAAAGAEMELERQSAAWRQWATEQRALIRQEVEQELAEEMVRRQQASVSMNPLNARPAAQGIEPPPGYEQVARRRFARPELAAIPDPFEGGVPES